MEEEIGKWSRQTRSSHPQLYFSMKEKVMWRLPPSVATPLRKKASVLAQRVLLAPCWVCASACLLLVCVSAFFLDQSSSSSFLSLLSFDFEHKGGARRGEERIASQSPSAASVASGVLHSAVCGGGRLLSLFRSFYLPTNDFV